SSCLRIVGCSLVKDPQGRRHSEQPPLLSPKSPNNLETRPRSAQNDAYFPLPTIEVSMDTPTTSSPLTPPSSPPPRLSTGMISRLIDHTDLMRRISIGSPSEMKSRRLRNSVRREQYYGSVELVVSVDPRGRIRNIGRFRLEPSSDCTMDGPPVSTANSIVLENPQEEMRWYWKFFLGNEHQNFCGCDPLTKDPIFLSIVVEEEIDDNKLCRAILWTSKGPRRMCIPIPPFRGKDLSVKTVIQRFPGFGDFNRTLTPITNPKIQKELTILEDQEGSVNCKFGVIYAKSDQNTDAQMLSNEHGDEAFERFLKILGQRIDLQGWGSYRGGLDTTTNSTGRESVYTVYGGHEIMFHVSTMLPFSKENDQQIERKRHVGNDIVNVIFEATDDPLRLNFSPTMMKSHFTHVFAVVTYCERTGVWRLWVFSEDSVPAFGPSIPHPNTFTDPARFREFLMTKLINAEKAAHNASAFVEKRHRTNDTLLKDMYIEYLKDCPKGFNRVTDAVIRHIRSPVRKDAPRESIDFCKFGELIKLEKMLSGEVVDAVKMNVCRRQPWDKEIMLRNMPSYDVIGSDMWGQEALLVATEEHGVMYVADDKNVMIFDSTCKVQDLIILEAFGLCLIRADKGKDGYVAVFSLNELRNALLTQVPIQKKIAHAHKIHGTKGCHLFARIEDGLRLKLVVAMGRKMCLFRWSLSALRRDKPGDNLAQHFTLLTTHSVSEEPVSMCVYEKRVISSVVKAVVLGRSHLFVYDLNDGTEEILAWDVPRNTSNIIMKAASDGESDEFAMLFQNSTLLFDRNDGRWNWEQTFWSTNLRDFAFRFPFIIGFGEDLIEIRLVVNGNLLASMYMPSVRLLSLKKDIYFSVERAFSSTCVPPSTPNSRSSLIRRERHQADTKRWDIYRFKGARLEMAGGEECSGAPGGVAASLTNGGSFTPQIIRRLDDVHGRTMTPTTETNNNHDAEVIVEKEGRR
ncbi:hypothetical protein PENTCL1PPCAC_27274, partial [Pristionchus entomophagus]